jgi:glycerophosphoryl diester phosphodiesterase
MHSLHFLNNTPVRFQALTWGLAIALFIPACATLQGGHFKTLNGQQPLIIAHRGSPGTLPEHTLEGYKLAIEQGADYIEPDLVLTKDGVMIARHEPMIDETTDVTEKFPASRKSTRVMDGKSITAFFVSDFTLAEVKTLRAKQLTPQRNQSFNGFYAIPTFDEVIALAKSEGLKTGRTIGVYPEIKHSSFHANELAFGIHTFENKLIATLHAAFGDSSAAPVFIQSFEVSNLQYLKSKTRIRLAQLIGADGVNDDGSMLLNGLNRRPYDFALKGDPRLFSDLLTDKGLDFVKTYADVIAPTKPYLVKTVNDQIERTGDQTLTINDRRVDGSTGVIERAHKKGLMVHTWTFRNDATGYGFSDPKAEMQYYIKLGIDGVFTDFTATGVAALGR